MQGFRKYFAKGEFPPRAWNWACYILLDNFKKPVHLKGNMHIDYLMAHKKDYLFYLYENKLELTMHDYFLGWDFLKDEDGDDVDKIKEVIDYYNLFNEKKEW